MRELPRYDTPEEGFYRMKLVRGGPWVGCRIWIAGDEFQCTVNGEAADIWEVWPRVGGRAISEEEYKRLQPDEPGRPIDKMRTKLVF